MKLINSFRITKTKLISTTLAGGGLYLLLRFIFDISCTTSSYYMEYGDYSKYSPLQTCGSITFSTLVTYYSIIFIPIIFFYIASSLEQYFRSK